MRLLHKTADFVPVFYGPALGQGELAGRRYSFEAVVCQNPTCDCKHVTLKCFTETPVAGPTASISLEMDLERRQIANFEELKANPVTQALATAYWGLKQYWTEHSDLEQVEVQFPADAATGAMVAYFDVFPFAKRIEFRYAQGNWMVDDQYCCNPRCTCQEAVLSFLRLEEKMEKGLLQPTLSVSYQYPGGKAIRLEREGDRRYFRTEFAGIDEKNPHQPGFTPGAASLTAEAVV